MKFKYIVCILSFFYLGISFSQVRSINYKALISDNTGSPLTNQVVTLQFTILKGNMAATEVYKETHSATTDTNGIVIVNIGEGTLLAGSYQTINWGNDVYFLKTEIDSGSGLNDFGTTEFKTVPYALYAETAGVSSPFSESTPNLISAANTNADFIVGSTSTEDQNDINSDSRMFYDKTKVAFRAGTVDGTQWDDSNRGLYSFAGGRNNTADGISSTAFGENNQVSGYGATSLGRQNVANGSNSLVAGFGNISSNMINAQTVLGKWNEVDTDALLIVGNGADNITRKNILSVKSDGNIIANDLSIAEITQSNALVTKAYVDANIGTPSTGLEALDEGNGNGWRLIGRNPSNYGNIGFNAIDLSASTTSSTRGALGNYSLATGLYTIANGTYSFAGGNGAIAQADYSFAFGSANTTLGTHSVAFGEISSARGNFSFAAGYNTTALGEASIALGTNVVASGNYSFAAGLNSNASGDYSLATGSNTTASGSFATALGWNTIASDLGSMAVGRYNVDDINAIFSVGNGDSFNGRKTAFKVSNSGIVNIDNLSGMGTRNVSVDANGNLLATSTQQNDILVITPFDFVKDTNNGINFTKSGLNGAYIATPGDNSVIYAPIQLPENVRITQVEYVYRDTSVQANEALEFKIRFQQFENNGSNNLQVFSVAGTILNTNSYPSTNRVATANISFPISSSATTYRAYFVTVEPVSGGQWSGTQDTAILQVRVHYTY
ncbi:hypothetical protein [Kordia zhangzhouensis]|uniref:hypothetical protein n=1 Tax=Kordia zhangzhouensis TaxID=1620405 RepID=UPI0006291775|nr:hypothetical protein [Kordia zhangzhouensis]